MNKNSNKLFIIRMKKELNYNRSLMFLKIVMNMMIILIYLKIAETVPDKGLTHLNLITLIEINHFAESPYQIIDRPSVENI